MRITSLISITMAFNIVFTIHKNLVDEGFTRRQQIDN